MREQRNNNNNTRVLMNTYPCAELGAKHDYSCIRATSKILCKHCIKTKRATMAQRQVTEAPRTVILQQS